MGLHDNTQCLTYVCAKATSTMNQILHVSIETTDTCYDSWFSRTMSKPSICICNHGAEFFVFGLTDSPISDHWSLKALSMCAHYLPIAFVEPTNEEALSNMMLAATYAGIGRDDDKI